MPCLVLTLIDWAYAHMLPEGFTNVDESGARVVNQACHLTLYHRDLQLMPWHHVPPGAWVTLRRGLFTDDLYSTPAWSFQPWERLHLTDLQRIQSLHAFQEYEFMVQKDLALNRDVNRRQQIIESMGHKRAQPHKKIFGISTACLQEASPDDADARLAPNGKLVKVTCNESEFHRALRMQSPLHHLPALQGPQYPALQQP